MSRFLQFGVLNQVKRIPSAHVARLCSRRFLSSGISTKSIHNDFRYSGTEKNAGALQDLLRRVMEIDADITNTPIVEFKPNTQQCMAYCIGDTIDLSESYSKLRMDQKEFKIHKKYDNMLHIMDYLEGGDIYLFDNGALVCWGSTLDRQSLLIDLIQDKKEKFNLLNEQVEYTIDEDEITDMNGDIIILNPNFPPIELSKIAFSYGFGRVAKLNTLEAVVDRFLDRFFNNYLHENKTDLFKELLCIHKRLFQSSRDGFLGTGDFHWAKPELEDYVNKVSKRFDVQTRIAILDKKLDHARQLISIANELNMLQ